MTRQPFTKRAGWIDVLSVLVPPLGVYRQYGMGKMLALNVVLTLCGYFLGVLHILFLNGQVELTGGDD